MIQEVILSIYRKHVFLLTIFICLSSVAFAQQNNPVSGTVVDASTGEPIPGANIIVEGTSRGVVTDFNGKYIIEAAQMKHYYSAL